MVTLSLYAFLKFNSKFSSFEIVGTPFVEIVDVMNLEIVLKPLCWGMSFIGKAL